MIAFFGYYCGWTVDEVLDQPVDVLEMLQKSLVQLIDVEKRFYASVHGVKLPTVKDLSKESVEQQLEIAKEKGFPIEEVKSRNG